MTITAKNPHPTWTSKAAVGSKSYKVLAASTFHVNEPKHHFAYQVY